MADDYIERKWRGYRDAVIPADAPKIQRVECKRAFFADAVHLDYTDGTA